MGFRYIFQLLTAEVIDVATYQMISTLVRTITQSCVMCIRVLHVCRYSYIGYSMIVSKDEWLKVWFVCNAH